MQTERKFLEIPGAQTFELPPLLIPNEVEVAISQEEVLDAIESDGLIELPDSVVVNDKLLKMVESARLDMAIQLRDRYIETARYWKLGDSILEWVRQCETTFKTNKSLNGLVMPDLWPHADHKNIAELLSDKDVYEEEELKLYVGIRLSHRMLPPIEYFSDIFLLFLKSVVCKSAYEGWANNCTSPSLPPDRFHFQVNFIDSEAAYL